MSDTFPVRLDGYTDLPPGKIANIVTFLERRNPPDPSPPSADFVARSAAAPTAAWYRGLYSRIGQNWLWFSRAVMPDEALTALITASTTEILTVEKDGAAVGLAELDFANPGEAEIVTFGVVPEAFGTGAAHALMAGALAAAFRPGVARVWLHTCTFDHPAAVRFYGANGFLAYKFAIEVSNDPRHTGALPAGVAPHVPFIRHPTR